MTHLLISLGGGVGLMVLAFLALHRFTPIRGKAAGAVVGLAACAAYVPMALARWPGADVFAIHFSVYLITAYALGFIGGHHERTRTAEPDRRWFHWGPAAIVAFFAVFIAADAVFVLLAERGLPSGLSAWLVPADKPDGAGSTAFPGVVYHDYREKEQHYNRHLAQLERQRERGWEVRKGWVAMPVAGSPAQFKLAVQTPAGQAVSGAVVEGRFLRYANSDLDRRFDMAEIAPGIYQTEITLPRPGEWHLVLTIDRDGQRHEVTGLTRVAPPGG